MKLLNITLLCDTEIHESLKIWLLDDFIPTTQQQNLFVSQSLLKVLNSPNEGVTFSLQCKAENETKVEQFRNTLLNTLHKKIQSDYANKVYLIESLMEYL